jgi:pimeloyl-ACP methyl ester carboxylesterase
LSLANREFTLLSQAYPFIFVLKFDNFNFEKGYVDAEPELFGAFEDEYVTLNDKKVPLYKDYSILIGKTLETKQHIKGLKYMFDPGKMGDLQELYLISPYNPDKIPVVLVHGLMSEPRTWSETLNILYGHRKIRTNYQFLFYSYPTGLPAIFNAAKFRKDLIKFKKKYDPDNTDPKMNSMILIGHSMGGLLTRMVVQDSKGNYLVNHLLEEDITKTKLTERQKNLLESIYVFEALPFVKSVVLIGTPHRGAEMATYFYSRIGSLMVSLPASMTHEAVGIMKGLDKTQLTRDFESLNIINGIDDLAPGKGLKKYTVNLPFGKNVVLYSIIGDKDKAGKKGGTDGVVAYESSHLDNVRREVIIKSEHDEIKKAACVKEITKILFENLEEYNKLHPSKDKKNKMAK